MCPSMSSGPVPHVIDTGLATLASLSKAFDSGTDRELDHQIREARSVTNAFLGSHVSEALAKYQRGELTRPQVRSILNDSFRTRQEQLASLKT